MAAQSIAVSNGKDSFFIRRSLSFFISLTPYQMMNESMLAQKPRPCPIAANRITMITSITLADLLKPLSAMVCPSPRTELLLIYRIQSHTHPKRRKFCLKHAGRKSVKEELPERRKGPKRAIECRLKVPTHVWDQETGRSSRPTRTSFLCLALRLGRIVSWKSHLLRSMDFSRWNFFHLLLLSYGHMLDLLY